MRVKKRNGRLEEYDVDKIHKMVEWACDGLNGVSVSDIEMNAELSLHDKITTHEIHEILIGSAADLISEEEPNYQHVAANLLLIQLRKEVWGSNQPPRLLDHIRNCVKQGVYDRGLLEWYSKDEINKLGTYIKHDYDEKFTYAGLQQLIDKYLLKNRNNGEVFETPQFAYLLVAMVLFREYDDRMTRIKEAYEFFATHKINLPTPIMAGVRTTIRQFASCCLVDVGDSLDSIFSSAEAVGKYTARRSGIGLNIGRMRPINSSIRGGEVIHTGLIPYLKIFESTVKAASQNGLRGGSATVHIPWWHPEIMDVMVLKNNAGTDDNRVRKLDYSVQFDRIFYERLVKKQDITLLSPHECPGLYEAFGSTKFKKLYEQYEKDESLQFRERIPALKLMESFLRERLETGRIYLMNMDNCWQNGTWITRPTMSNLCQEIVQPTRPTQHIDDPDAEIGVCILSAINLLEIKTEEELEQVCDVIVRMLDALIDYQEYPVKAAKTFTTRRRSLGIGITNLAALLATHKLSYHDQESLELVDEWMEHIQYYLLSSSCQLAEEKGRCDAYEETRYSQGLMPMDWANKDAQGLVKRKPDMPWDELRERIRLHGLRHSTLSAIMPAESSSVIQNSTNGIEPVRRILSVKKAKNGTLKQLVPRFYKYRNYYDLAFDFRSNKGIIEIVATLQKWIDMSISTNQYYNYLHYEDENIPLSIMMRDTVLAYKLGVKTLYYCNTPDGSVDATTEKQDEACSGGGCAI